MKRLFNQKHNDIEREVFMTAAYWAQWSYTEIMSMHGVELDQHCEEDIDFDYECDEINEDCEDYCRSCRGVGCNYCLMCEW